MKKKIRKLEKNFLKKKTKKKRKKEKSYKKKRRKTLWITVVIHGVLCVEKQ